MAAFIIQNEASAAAMLATARPGKTGTMAGDPVWRRKVSERAHEIWEREGRPYGRAGAHWLQAETELRAEEETDAKDGHAAECTAD